MKKILDYALSTLYLVYFFLILLIFHPLQIIFFELFGQRSHQKLIHVMNFFLLYGTVILGTNIKFNSKINLPTNRPIIFVANHQSLFDIIGMIWFLSKN